MAEGVQDDGVYVTPGGPAETGGDEYSTSSESESSTGGGDVEGRAEAEGGKAAKKKQAKAKKKKKKKDRSPRAPPDFNESDSDNEEADEKSGWLCAVDHRTGRRYYYNRRTKQSQFKAPKDYSEPEWRQAIDALSNKYYYYSRRTGKVTWEKPSERFRPASRVTDKYEDPQIKAKKLKKLKNDPKLQKEGYWKESFDKTTRRNYFYHTKTKQTSWKRPDVYVSREGKIKFKRRSARDAESIERKKKKRLAEKQSPLRRFNTTGQLEDIVEREKEELDAIEEEDNHSEMSISFLPVEGVASPGAPPPQLKTVGDWKQAVDKRSGKLYWFNKLTKEVRWLLPPGVLAKAKEARGAEAADDEEKKRPVSDVDEEDEDEEKEEAERRRKERRRQEKEEKKRKRREEKERKRQQKEAARKGRTGRSKIVVPVLSGSDESLPSYSAPKIDGVVQPKPWKMRRGKKKKKNGAAEVERVEVPVTIAVPAAKKPKKKAVRQAGGAGPPNATRHRKRRSISNLPQAVAAERAEELEDMVGARKHDDGTIDVVVGVDGETIAMKAADKHMEDELLAQTRRRLSIEQRLERERAKEDGQIKKISLKDLVKKGG